jgi:hypothetical protein
MDISQRLDRIETALVLLIHHHRFQTRIKDDEATLKAIKTELLAARAETA